MRKFLFAALFLAHSCLFAQDKPTLIYIADPMCSWCYGFAPQISKVKEELGDRVNFELVMGGLNPFEENLLDEETKDFFKEHWPEIAETSGQPFSFSLMHSDSAFVYDTEPPARAVVTMRKLKPEAEFAFFKAVQHAFYENGQNTNYPKTYIALLERWSVSHESFMEAFLSDDIRKETIADFAKADLLSKNGFPTVLLKLPSGKIKTIAEGYVEAPQMLSKIKKAVHFK